MDYDDVWAEEIRNRGEEPPDTLRRKRTELDTLRALFGPGKAPEVQYRAVRRGALAMGGYNPEKNLVGVDSALIRALQGTDLAPQTRGVLPHEMGHALQMYRNHDDFRSGAGLRAGLRSPWPTRRYEQRDLQARIRTSKDPYSRALRESDRYGWSEEYDSQVFANAFETLRDLAKRPELLGQQNRGEVVRAADDSLPGTAEMMRHLLKRPIYREHPLDLPEYRGALPDATQVRRPATGPVPTPDDLLHRTPRR
jgi:hypothetical protein